MFDKSAVFTERCYASAVLAMDPCVLSVCSSVRPSQVGVLLKRLCKIYGTANARDFKFCTRVGHAKS